MSKRTVSFYGVCIEDSEASTFWSNDEVFERFKSILDSMTNIANGNRARRIEHKDKNYIVEVLSPKNDEKTVFIKIGRETPENTIDLRDQALNADDIRLEEGQSIEVYTYCLIDFEACIMSFIGITGAPNVAVIIDLLQDGATSILVTLPQIIDENILDIVCRKSIISRVSVDIAVPEHDKLIEHMFVDERAFEGMRNIKRKNMQIVIVGEKGKNIFSSRESGLNYFNMLKNTFNSKLKHINVNAKNYDETMEKYDLLSNRITKKVDLEATGDHDGLTGKDFESALLTTYNENKDYLVSMFRQD